MQVVSIDAQKRGGGEWGGGRHILYPVIRL
jgi:hypothetical protein